MEETVPSKQIGMLVHDPMSPWYTPCTGVRLPYGEATKVNRECQSDHRGSDPLGNGAIPLQVPQVVLGARQNAVSRLPTAREKGDRVFEGVERGEKFFSV